MSVYLCNILSYSSWFTFRCSCVVSRTKNKSDRNVDAFFVRDSCGIDLLEILRKRIESNRWTADELVSSQSRNLLEWYFSSRRCEVCPILSLLKARSREKNTLLAFLIKYLPIRSPAGQWWVSYTRHFSRFSPATHLTRIPEYNLDLAPRCRDKSRVTANV